MSKSDLIRGHLERGGLTTAEIGQLVGCTDVYVRAVRNRMRNKEAHGSGEYPAEKLSARARWKRKYQTDAEFRRRARASIDRAKRAWRERDPENTNGPRGNRGRQLRTNT